MPSTQIIKKMENGGQKSLLFYPISDYPYHSKTKPLKTSFFFFKKNPPEREKYHAACFISLHLKAALGGAFVFSVSFRRS